MSPATAVDAARLTALLALLVLTALLSMARAAEAPLWEFGLGVGGVVFDDYRGASTAHAYPLPVPYLIYRGDFLRADRDGMRGLFLRRPRFEVDVSLNATVPVSSTHSVTRSGMPDLRSTVEIGPALEWHLWRSADGGTRLDLRAPLRTAITVQAPPHDIGWVAAPAANLDILDAFGRDGWNLGLLSGPLFANRRYHEYFYGVPGAYATLQRPAYSAPGGYSGTEALVALSKRYGNFWVGAFLRHDWLSGAAFIASPLLQQRSYWAGGAGIAWMIGQSSQQVNVDD